MVLVERDSIDNHSNGRRAAAWLPLAAGVLECAEADVRARAGALSFTRLGGTSLRAIEFSALLTRRRVLAVSPQALLGPEPLADVMRAAAPVVPSIVALVDRSERREPIRVQQAMLFSEQLYGGCAFHLLFSAEIRGPVDHARLASALAWLTRRPAALRTVFVRDDDGGLRRRVLAQWTPVVIEQSLPAPAGDGPVAAVHATLGPASGSLLRPYERPPVVFVLTRVTATHVVLSLLIHHAIADGWSIGLLWKELFARLALAAGTAPDGAQTLAPSVDPVIAHERSDAVARRARHPGPRRARGPTTVAVPSHLAPPARLRRRGAQPVLALTEGARRGC